MIIKLKYCMTDCSFVLIEEKRIASDQLKCWLYLHVIFRVYFLEREHLPTPVKGKFGTSRVSEDARFQGYVPENHQIILPLK